MVRAMPAPLIEFDRVTVLRDGVTALDRLSLRIDDGERVAVLGPNGAGKSTLVDALTRAVYPATGLGPSAVRIYGRDRWDVFELRNLLGIVTHTLVRDCTGPYTALETVLSGFFGSIGVWPHHEVTAQMRESARLALGAAGHRPPGRRAAHRDVLRRGAPRRDRPRARSPPARAGPGRTHRQPRHPRPPGAVRRPAPGGAWRGPARAWCWSRTRWTTSSRRSTGSSRFATVASCTMDRPGRSYEAVRSASCSGWTCTWRSGKASGTCGEDRPGLSWAYRERTVRLWRG